MKIVSVIIPAYNEEKRIEKCVSSVCGQSYKDLEIIIVNDGSTDATPALADAMAEKDGRVRVIHRDNGGISAARNSGLAAATGDYICWLDSDDWMEPGMIESLVHAAEANAAEIALTNYQNIYSETDKRRRYQIDGDVIMSHDEALHALVKRSITQSVWGNIARRSLYDGVVFPEGRLFEDVRTMWRIYDGAEKVVLVDRMQMNRLNHKDSLSSEGSIYKRVESSEGYLERQAALRDRYPQWEDDFVRENYRMILFLRTAVIHSNGATYRAYRERIRAIVGYFREHGDVFPGREEGLLARIEHALLTSGTRMGFMLSWGVGRLSGKKTFLKRCFLYQKP